MALTILVIWVGSITIGMAGAAAAVSNRWVRVLGWNVVAGIYSITILASLRGAFAVSLLQAGDIYVWITMASPIVMWVILGVGASTSIWKERSRLTATQ